MRYEKIKNTIILEENINNNEVNNMKCPMCGLDETHQQLVESDSMMKPKCTGCGTIFYDSSMK